MYVFFIHAILNCLFFNTIETHWIAEDYILQRLGNFYQSTFIHCTARLNIDYPRLKNIIIIYHTAASNIQEIYFFFQNRECRFENF